MTILHTPRLRMVPVECAHVGALHALWTEPKVRRFLWDDEVISRDRALEAIRCSELEWAELGLGQRAMLLRRQGDTLIGFCGFRCFEDTGEPELLYGAFSDYWGEGLMTEAVHATVRDAFCRTCVPRVIAATTTPNQASVQIMQRVGMVFQCRREWHGLDTVFYLLTREDYAAHLQIASG